MKAKKGHIAVRKSSQTLEVNKLHYKYSSEALYISCASLLLILLILNIYNTWHNNDVIKSISVAPSYTTAKVIIEESRITRTTYEFYVDNRLYSGSSDQPDYNSNSAVCVSYLKSDPTVNTVCESQKKSYLNPFLLTLLCVALLTSLTFIAKFNWFNKSASH
ncbi:hypothetical protein ABDD95_24125 [Mucilaginibacter sp. PAMB04274]|uniref:hypothetical protein n=1 Tax=Mucilaginibacter sp. PAMB04274 TaxID=3138568 RepID=UPI00331F0C24